jgi:flavin-dependent dehydrogenase
MLKFLTINTLNYYLMKEYDYSVIGAGPAGSYIAKKLASQGFNVLLCDKKKL